MAYYRELRDQIKALEEKGKLIRVTRPINKDTEMHPLMRLQFRGLPEEERKAWLFENVYDSKGKRYDMPVLIGALGASPQVYAIGLKCEVDEIGKRWARAQANPIPPIMVKEAPVQEVVYSGETLMARGCLEEFPIPVSTPGWDVAPYMTSPYWVTKDTETGIRNVGTYRAQIKSPGRTGVYVAKYFRGLAHHWRKCRELGKPLEAAVIIGAPPNVGYTSVTQLPTDVDEYTIAGGLAGEPVELVKCKTVDLEVPAHSEIVIEGEISTSEVELEAPFGESTGYVGQRETAFIFTVKCITHRKSPIWQSFISQFPPSESSTIRQIACANVIPKRLRELGITNLRQAAVHFTNGIDRYVVLQMGRTNREEIWSALEAMPKNYPAFSKIIVAVDEDINPQNANLVNWAITYRCQPHRDVKIVMTHAPDGMDYSVGPPRDIPWAFLVKPEEMPECSVLLIDATRKWDYPPVSLPKKEYMDEAIRLWQEMGMPPLKLEEPWYGYNLGNWTDQEEEEAKWATMGEHYRAGERMAKERQVT
jgi:UbiD family decarboxylase